MHPIDISILLVSYNTADLLAACLECLYKSTATFRREVIVVDNASRDHSADFIKTHHLGCRLIENAENLGFGRANNQALRWVTGRYLLLLNTDAFVESDTIEKTVAYMDAHPRCGVLGVKLVGRDGVVQPSARYFPTPWNLFLARTGLNRIFPHVRMVDDMTWDHASVRQCDWVPGCYYLVRKEVIDQVGLFDARYFLYYEEVDHCLAAKRAGWEVVFYPHTSVIHIGGESAKSESEITQSGRQIEALQLESELLYFRKNHGISTAWMDVLLTTLGGAIIILKRLLKRKSPLGLGVYAKHVALIWFLFGRTRWGTHPTR